MFAMAGASREHNRVNENLSVAIGGQLRGGPCQSFSRDLRVRVDPTGLYTYPDVIVVCGEQEYDTRDRDKLVNPTVLFEVLSPSTEKYDRDAEFRQYKHIASLKEYILVKQDEPLVDQFVRQPNGKWQLTTLTGLDDELVLESVPARVHMKDIYDRVEFPEKPLR